MIILKTIELLVLLAPIYFFLNFLISVRNHRKTMKKMKEWSAFNGKMLKMVDEIKDNIIKQEYLEFCIDSSFKSSVEQIKKGHLDSVKDELIRRFSNHIPSLKQELRDKKLNQILK